MQLIGEAEVLQEDMVYVMYSMAREYVRGVLLGEESGVHRYTSEEEKFGDFQYNLGIHI